MLAVLLCDDDPHMIRQYGMMIKEFAKKHQIMITLSVFKSAESLLFYISGASGGADIIYLDILMAGQNGMDAARQLRAGGCEAQLIFLTTSEDYVFEAFNVAPVQYLLKHTTSASQFEQTFLRAAALAQDKNDDIFHCEYGATRWFIPLKSISHFEIWKRIVTVHYGKGQTAQFYSSMEQLEQRLTPKNFARPHRSFLVHLPFIDQLRPKNLLLKTGEVIPVGGTYIQAFKNEFSRYISSSHIYWPENLQSPAEKAARRQRQ